MRVLLLQALTSPEKLWGKYAAEGGLIPPIGLLTIASYLESKGHSVEILDCAVAQYTDSQLRDFLRRNTFDIIGVPAFTNTVSDTYKTIILCRESAPGSKLVVGGVHATILPQRTMQECEAIDFLVQGEAEKTLEELLCHLETQNPPLEKIKGLAFRNATGQIVLNEKRELIGDINSLPMPAYHLLDMSKYIPHPTQYKVLPSYPVIFQRGCPFNCAFCGAHTVHGRILRHKSVNLLISEIELLINQYGARGIHFQDSTFTVSRKYVAELCHEIIRRQLHIRWDINTRVDCLDEELLVLMKQAGLWMINFGLESGNQASLDLLNKRTTLDQIEKTIQLVRKNKIVTFSTWILGIPGEDEEMVKNTIRFAKHLGTELALFFLPVPYPGTPLVDICRKMGGFREDAQWEDYSAVDFANPVYVNPLLGKEKMQELLQYAFRTYYTSPKILWRNFRAIDSWADVRRYVRGARVWFHGLT